MVKNIIHPKTVKYTHVKNLQETGLEIIVLQLFLLLPDIPLQAFPQAVEPVCHMTSIVNGGDWPQAGAHCHTEMER